MKSITYGSYIKLFDCSQKFNNNTLLLTVVLFVSNSRSIILIDTLIICAFTQPTPFLIDKTRMEARNVLFLKLLHINDNKIFSSSECDVIHIVECL